MSDKPEARTSQDIQRDLDDVRELMLSTLRDTPLSFLANESLGVLGGGKMLRSRLLFRVGPSADVPRNTLLHAAAATEMIHVASLLHDDVIDGGLLRRGAPAFWTERGISGAILLGDTLLFKAIDVVCRVEKSRLAHPLSLYTGEVCQAEVEQELIFRGKDAAWQDCVRIARQKTGALFAFPAYAAGGPDTALAVALSEAGYAVGTAYQLADDILDAKGTPASSDKTLGTDQAREKKTIMNYVPPELDIADYIEALCVSSTNHLLRWPDVAEAWQMYLNEDLSPALEKHLRLLRD